MKKFQKAISLLLTLAMMLSAEMQVYAASPVDNYDGLSNDTEIEEVNEVVSEEPTQSPQSDNNSEETPIPTQTAIEEDYLPSEDVVLGDDFTDSTPTPTPTSTPTSTPTATPTPEIEENISDAVVLNYAELEVSFYDYVITASGNMPENAVLSVSKVFDYDALEEQIGDEDYHIYAAFDIQISVDGVEWQPLVDNEEIQITLKTIDSDTNNETSVSAEDTIVYRIFDDSDIEDIAENNDDIEVSDIDKVTELATEVFSDNSVTVNTDHFTVYTFGGKTVDTPNGETATYLINGESFNLALKQLVDDSITYTDESDDTIVEIIWVDAPWDNVTDSTNLAEAGAPVYARLSTNDNGDTIVELYSTAETVYLNNDCCEQFCCFEALETIDFSKTNTSLVDNMSSMFNGCYSLDSMDVSHWDTSNVTGMVQMFYDCENIRNLDVSNWDVSNISSFYQMFYQCYSLESIDVSSWDTSSASEFEEMFIDCYALESIDMSNWELSGRVNLCNMFSDCSSLEYVKTGNWALGNYSNIRQMFAGCTSLKSLDVSGWNISSNYVDGFLFRCSGLESLKLFSVNDSLSGFELPFNMYLDDNNDYTADSSTLYDEPLKDNQIHNYIKNSLTYTVSLSWKNTTDKNISEDVTSGENFDISYILHISTSDEYNTNNLEVRVPYALWRHKTEQFPVAYNRGRFTEYLIPSDIGCAQAPATSNDVAFNYSIDTKDTESVTDDEIVFKNFQALGSGNTSTSTDIEVRYTIKPFIVKDMSKVTIYAHAFGQSISDTEPVSISIDGSDALTYQLDTGFDSSTSRLREGAHYKYKFLYGKSLITEAAGNYLDESDIDTENYIYVGYGIRSDNIETNMASQLYTYHLAFEDTNYPDAEALTWINHGSYWYRTENGCSISGNEWNDNVGARVKQGDSLNDAMIAGSSNIHGTVVVRYPKDEVLNSGKKLNGNFTVEIIAMDDDSHTSPDDNDYFEMSWSTGDITYEPYRYNINYVADNSYINIEGNNPSQLGPSQLLNLKYSQDAISGQIDGEVTRNMSVVSQNDPAQGFVATQKYQKTEVYLDNFYWNLSNDTDFTKMTEEDYEFAEIRDINIQYHVEDVTSGNIEKPRDAEHIIGDVKISGYKPNDGWEEIATLNISNIVDSSSRLCFIKDEINEGESLTNNNIYYTNTALKGRGYTKIKIESPMVAGGYLQVRYYFKLDFKGDSPALRNYLSANSDVTQIKVACISGSKQYHTDIDDETNTLIYDSHYIGDNKSNWNIPWYFQTLTQAELESQCPNMLSEIYADDVASGFYGYEYTTGGMQRQCYIGTLNMPAMLSNLETRCLSITNDSTNRRIKAEIQAVATEQIDTRDGEWATKLPEILNNFTGKYSYIYTLLPMGYYVDESAVRLGPVQNYWTSMPWWLREGSINNYFQSHKDECLTVIDNYNNTGRQMVIVKYINNEDFTWFNNGDQAWGYYTGANVKFNAYCDWADVIYNRTLGDSKILSAYQCSQALDGNERTVVGPSSSNIGYPDVLDDSNQTVLDFKAATSNIDGSYAFSNIWQGGTNSETKNNSTLYHSLTINPDVAMSVESGLSKTVKGALQKYQTVDEIGINRPYSYRLTVTNSASGTLNNVILYDILENAQIAGETSWRGTFDSVDTSYAESLGINAKVYYSTGDLEYGPHVISNSAQPDTWLDDGISDGTWKLLNDSVDKTTVKAIAVDLRKKTDGSSFNVPNSGILYAVINMRSPSIDPRNEDENKTSAFNKTASSYNQSGNNNLIVSSRTKISLATKDISVSVHWNDCDNWYENRPDKIRITLYADGIDTGKYVELDTDDDADIEFANLDVYNENGRKIEYTVVEDAYNSSGMLYDDGTGLGKNLTFYDVTYEADSSDENHLIVKNAREQRFLTIAFFNGYYDSSNNIYPFYASDGSEFEVVLQKPDGSYGFISPNVEPPYSDAYIASPSVSSEHPITLNLTATEIANAGYTGLGVEEGILTITQTKAPNGAYVLKEPLVMEVRRKISFNDNEYHMQNSIRPKTLYTQTNTITADRDTLLMVINETQASLVTAGGKGTKFFLLLGLICIIFSLFIFLRYRRKHD